METSLSTQLAQTDLTNKVSTAVLAKSLQDLRQNGADVSRLLASAAPQTFQDPAVGSRVNTLV